MQNFVLNDLMSSKLFWKKKNKSWNGRRVLEVARVHLSSHTVIRLQLACNRVFSNANGNLSLFNEIPQHEPPLHVNKNRGVAD